MTFLGILLILLMLGAVVALVRGIIALLRTTEADLNNASAGPSESSVKQNKAMMMRIIFQGAAILVIVLILASRHSG
jgi:NADH:ubiquinone oxidoreductase subunit 6 (subunit J)